MHVYICNAVPECEHVRERGQILNISQDKNALVFENPVFAFEHCANFCRVELWACLSF